MKKKIFVFIVTLFLTLLIVQPFCPVVHSYNHTGVHYAVVICGSSEIPALATTAYFVKWCLMNIFDVLRGNIKFLVTPWPQMPNFIADDYDDVATYENVQGAIQWLANQNGYLFVYATGHGGGYNSTGLDYGRWDADGDEGPEHYVDGEWKGVDECICLRLMKANTGMTNSVRTFQTLLTNRLQ